MKILVALHPCMDLGGIINHTEQLIGGLKDLGHKVDLKEFNWKTKVHGSNKAGKFVVGPSGIPHDQGKGWNFHSSDRVAYRAGMIQGARQILERYDLIIWTVPVPSKNKNNRGNRDWPKLYDVKVPQIAFIHDGNAVQGNGHLIAIEHHLSGLACVHPCAYNGAEAFRLPKKMIVNPQENPVREKAYWWDKSPGFVNMQTFKAWKHVHELIEAIAYMPRKREGELREVAGRGIEYQYLTSEDKCKPQYFHDPNGFAFERDFAGEKFWDAALANGMTHHDYWDAGEVDSMLTEARVLVDPSWSRKYSQVGGHFNRVVVDAMIRGAIPVARRAGMGDEVFKAGEHYVEIPQNATPRQYADIVLGVGDMEFNEAKPYLQAAEELLPMFDRKRVAQQVLDLAEGDGEPGAGLLGVEQTKKIEDYLFNHFGILI